MRQGVGCVGRLVQGACLVRQGSWQEGAHTLAALLRPLRDTTALSPERGHHAGGPWAPRPGP